MEKIKAFKKVQDIIDKCTMTTLEPTLKAIELFHTEHNDDSLYQVLKMEFKNKREQYEQ